MRIRNRNNDCRWNNGKSISMHDDVVKISMDDFSGYENLDGIICCQNSDLLHPDDRMYAINGTLTH